MVQVVVLTPNGESRTLKTGAITGVPTGEMVAKAMRKTRAAELIGTYKAKDAILQLWGWKSGKAGTENKQELPPPHDKILLFSEIVVTNSTGKDFVVEEWKEFYNQAFAEGGQDDSDNEGGDDVESEEEASIDGDAVEEEYDEEIDDAGSDVGVEDEDGEVEESDEEVEDEEEDDAVEDEEDIEEDDEADDDCYDEGDDNGGGGRRRTPRRRTTQGPEYRRMELGVRSRIKMPAAVGKRAPRWQTAPELTVESYNE